MSLTQRVERVEQESARTAGKPARPRAQARTASRETEWAQMKRRGKIERRAAAFMDDGQFRQVIEKMVARVGRRIDEASPMVDARLPDGSRINAVIPPVAVDSPVLTIRRFPEKAFEIKDLISFGSLSIDAAGC